MPISHNVPRVNFAQALAAVDAAVRANVVPLLIGDPGVGKSSLAREAGRRSQLNLVTLIGSTLDPTDVGGMPVLRGDGLDRVPLSIVRDCSTSARLLLVDELSSAPGPVQAALLRLILDRWAGDVKLHEGTRLIAATNPEEQTPAGAPLSAPLVGRVMMMHLRPDEAEVVAYFSTLGADGSRLREEAADLAATWGVMPDLLQVDMPPACAAGNDPWGAPRSWEHAARARAVVDPSDESTMHAVTAACVGTSIAAAHRGVMRMRKDLPTVDQILADPAGVKLPTDGPRQAAAVGLVPRVAERNTWAAWVFTSRLRPEIATACGRHLQGKKDSPVGAAHAKEGVRARVAVASTMKGA